MCQQLAQGCLQWTGCESNPQPLGYESDTLPLDGLVGVTSDFNHHTLVETEKRELGTQLRTVVQGLKCELTCRASGCDVIANKLCIL